MKKVLIAAAASLLFCVAGFAQTPPKASNIAGKVTKVDASAGKITIDHGPIAVMEMPAMTMVFKAGEEAMLKAVKVGDAVRFNVERVNGQLTVTKIEKGK